MFEGKFEGGDESLCFCLKESLKVEMGLCEAVVWKK